MKRYEYKTCEVNWEGNTEDCLAEELVLLNEAGMDGWLLILVVVCPTTLSLSYYFVRELLCENLLM